jgi:hypothetical protein
MRLARTSAALRAELNEKSFARPNGDDLILFAISHVISPGLLGAFVALIRGDPTFRLQRDTALKIDAGCVERLADEAAVF